MSSLSLSTCEEVVKSYPDNLSIEPLQHTNGKWFYRVMKLNNGIAEYSLFSYQIENERHEGFDTEEQARLMAEDTILAIAIALYEHENEREQ